MIEFISVSDKGQRDFSLFFLECASPAYGVLAATRVGVAHAICGMEVLDDVLRDLR